MQLSGGGAFAVCLAVSGTDGGATARSISGGACAGWTVRSTVGSPRLAAGALSAGWGRTFDSPSEHDSNLTGWGKRCGLRLSGVAASNALQVGLGALWKEDPRYFWHGGRPQPGKRIWDVVRWSVAARDDSGRPVPAYVPYAVVSGSNFLSDTWRPGSHAAAPHAAPRTAYGVLGRITSNAFAEFWADIGKRTR